MVLGGQKRIVFKKIVLSLMVSLLMPAMTIGVSMQTYAKVLDEEDMFIYGENGIYYYNPKGSDSCAGSYTGGPIVIKGTTIKEKIWSGLTSFLTEEQSAGVMGNMQSESNFNPAQHEVELMNRYQPGFDLGANEDVSYGLGLIQWSFGRRVSMYNYVGGTDSALLDFFNDYNTYSSGYSVTGDVFLQLAGDDATNALLSLEIQFLKDELESTYSGIFNTSTVDEATRYFLESVEIPVNPTLESHPERLTQAEAIYSELAGSSPEGGSGSGGSSCNTDSGALEEYVRKYVWPDYRKVDGQNYTNRMPDYADAVSGRQSTGQYVGGSVDGVAGIDCGGFVTTIMQESGYDTGYNGCQADYPDSANVAMQEYWLREGGGAESWERLNPNDENMDAGDLQLGDVAFVGDYTGGCVAGGDHTFMFIGSLDGYETNIASASYDSGKGDFSGRAPMSGHESVSGVRWYRKVK